jgi:hypothetical protein
MMTKAELKFLEAVGYGGYASALRQAQEPADAVTLPGAWLWRNVPAAARQSRRIPSG